MKPITRLFFAILILAVSMLGLVIVAGCSQSDKPDPARIEGDWVLSAFGGVSKLEDADPSVRTEITFSDSEVTGNGGVNSFGSTYEAETSGAISIEPIIATKMAGPEPAMNQETAFFAALEKAQRFSFNGDDLVLSDKGNNTLVVLSPK